MSKETEFEITTTGKTEVTAIGVIFVEKTHDASNGYLNRMLRQEAMKLDSKANGVMDVKPASERTSEAGTRKVTYSGTAYRI